MSRNWKYFKNELPKPGTVIRTAFIFDNDPEPSIDVKALYNQHEVDELVNDCKESYDYEKSMWEFITDIKLSDSDIYRKENVNFSVVDQTDDRWEEFKQQRLERGFDESELWNLDTTIAMFIIPRLKAFKAAKAGYPGELASMEEWETILDKIISAFETHEDGKFIICDKEESQKRHEKIQEGLDLFAKYFGSLWW